MCEELRYYVLVNVLNVLLCTTGKKKGEKGPIHERYVLLIEEDIRKQCFKLLFSNFELNSNFHLAAIGRELTERNHN